MKIGYMLPGEYKPFKAIMLGDVVVTLADKNFPCTRCKIVGKTRGIYRLKDLATGEIFSRLRTEFIKEGEVR